MIVKVIAEKGLKEALFGIGLSHGVTSGKDFDAIFDEELFDRMVGVATRLAPLDNGHSKFLESIVVYLDITAPRYWWSEFDTYRVGMSKQSESTVHTIHKKAFTQEQFEGGMDVHVLDGLNDARREYLAQTDQDMKNFYFLRLKRLLPESYLQRRIVCTNYKALRGIVKQRKGHRLPEWRAFINELKALSYPEWITDEPKQTT